MTVARNAFWAIALSGCGLISSNTVSYDLNLPAKSFSIDASGWQVSQSIADAYLDKNCASSPTLCTTAATSACPMNCSGSCNPSAHTCDLGLEIAVHQTIDLLTEKPELKSVDNATTILHVTVDALTYEVTANALDIDTPVLTVYLAPMSIMDPRDPMAQEIGTIAVVRAGAVVPATDMMFSDGGQDVLTATLANFKNPFNVIVGGTLMLHAGDAVPTGKLDANVHIKAHASP